MSKKDASFGHLRPTTAPEMLDRAYAVSVRIAPILWGCAFVSATGSYALSAGMDWIESAETSNPYMVAGILPLILFAEYAIAVALLALFQGLIFPRRPLGVKPLTRTALRKLPGFFLTNLLYLFTVMVIAVVAYAVFTLETIPGGLYGRALAGTAVAIVGLWMTVRLSLAPIICLIEDASPFSAFVRSRLLTSTRAATSHRRSDNPVFRWLAAAALPGVLMLAIAAAFGAYAYLRLEIRAPLDWESPPVSNLLNLFEFAAGIIAAPLYWAGLMGLYVEYRMRHEALDFYLRLRDQRRNNGDAAETFGVDAD